MLKFLSIIILFLVSCGGATKVLTRVNVKEKPTSEEQTQNDLSFSVIPYDIDDIDFSKINFVDTTVSIVENERVRRIIKGWRIQVMSISNYERATEFENVLSDQLEATPYNVYKDFHSPNYTIRVGDFRAKEDAIKILNLIKQLGYRGAWPVQDKIVVYH